MILMQGKGVSKGVVKGPIYFYQRAQAAAARTAAADIEEEKRRLEEAKEKSMEQLGGLADKAREEAGEEAAMLFETHAMFVEDEDFCDCMNAALEEGCTAERAVEKAEVRLDELAQEAEEAASDYLRLQEIYKEREAAEDELARLYGEWERLAAELEEAQA